MKFFIQIDVMERLIDGFLGNGILGACFLGLAWYLIQRDKKNEALLRDMMNQHREERKEWQAIAKENVEQNKETTGVISGLKSLFETTLRK